MGRNNNYGEGKKVSYSRKEVESKIAGAQQRFNDRAEELGDSLNRRQQLRGLQLRLMQDVCGWGYFLDLDPCQVMATFFFNFWQQENRQSAEKEAEPAVA